MHQFLDNGNLFPGIHSYSLTEFRTQFIDDFPESVRRKDIFDNFRKWTKQLVDIHPPAYMWLDGSYLTKKVDPKDIDLVVFYDLSELLQYEEKVEKIKNHINEVSRSMDCDAYLCFLVNPDEYPELSQDWGVNRTYWMGQFGFDRQERAKGMVRLDHAELLKLGGGTVGSNQTRS